MATIGIAAWNAAEDGTSPNAATNASATIAAGGIGTSASSRKIGSRSRSVAISTVRCGSRSATVASSSTGTEVGHVAGGDVTPAHSAEWVSAKTSITSAMRADQSPSLETSRAATGGAARGSSRSTP